MRAQPLARVAVALDTSDWTTYLHWCGLFGAEVGLLKVGLESFIRWGPEAVDRAAEHAAGVFLDLKLHDIPNTVAGAAAAARRPGVRFLTAHAGGGESMLEAAVRGAGEEMGVLAVTVLTHLDDQALERLDFPGRVTERALSWAQMAHRAGCAGVVCSPRELSVLRAELPAPFLLVTPGVRPSGSTVDDQKRTATPAAALAAGADYLVVGRPLTRAHDPRAALAALGAELAP